MNPDVRILVFTGDGKGKTTAALGMALRAAGHGLPVAVIQFVKADRTVGEIQGLTRLPGVSIVQAGRGFLPKAGDAAIAVHQAAAREGLAEAERIVAAGETRLVILDEICVAVAKGLLTEADVLAVLRRGRAGTCIVLTGRGATESLLAAADTATEMREVKHGLKSGIVAQAGVEW
jgi:cob(I)alamin adenosyltransferase